MPAAQNTNAIYLHACNKKQKHAKKRGNPPPSRHPDHILFALVSAAREAYRPQPGPPELNENPSLRIPNQIIICTEITGGLWPNKTLRGLSFLSTNQPLHHKQVMLTHVLNTQNSTRISFSGIWKSTVIWQPSLECTILLRGQWIWTETMFDFRETNFSKMPPYPSANPVEGYL